MDGNAITCAPPASPSSLNCAYGSLRFVYLRWTPPMIPPIVTRSPSPSVSRSAISFVVCAASSSCTSSNGWSVTNCPSTSFSSRSSVRLSNSSPSSTDSSTSVTPESPPNRRTARRPPPCVRRGSAPRPCPGSSINARRAYPSESNAPAKTQALQDALGEHRRLHLATEIPEGRERPLAAAGVDRSGRRLPPPRCARRTTRYRMATFGPRGGSEVVLGLVDVGRQDLDAHEAAGVQVEAACDPCRP